MRGLVMFIGLVLVYGATGEPDPRAAIEYGQVISALFGIFLMMWAAGILERRAR